MARCGKTSCGTIFLPNAARENISGGNCAYIKEKRNRDIIFPTLQMHKYRVIRYLRVFFCCARLRLRFCCALIQPRSLRPMTKSFQPHSVQTSDAFRVRLCTGVWSLTPSEGGCCARAFGVAGCGILASVTSYKRSLIAGARGLRDFAHVPCGGSILASDAGPPRERMNQGRRYYSCRANTRDGGDAQAPAASRAPCVFRRGFSSGQKGLQWGPHHCCRKIFPGSDFPDASQDALWFHATPIAPSQ